MEELARRYLDLWQENVSAAAADPDIAAALARFFGQFNLSAAAPAASREASEGGKAEVAKALADIEWRLGEVEKRLEALERLKRKKASKPRTAKGRKGQL